MNSHGNQTPFCSAQFWLSAAPNMVILLDDKTDLVRRDACDTAMSRSLLWDSKTRHVWKSEYAPALRQS